MRGILLATHGGGSADGAVRVAHALARKLAVPLRALGVVEPAALVDGGLGMPCFETPEAEEARQAALRAAIEDQLMRCEVSADVGIASGPPAEEIAAAARDDDAELIVLGIGSHRLLDRALGQETAHHLVRAASAPVLAVAAGARTPPHHAVVAVDFSPTSFVSARTVTGWMREGDIVHLVHVAQFGQSSVKETPDRTRAAALLATELAAMAMDLRPRDGVVVRTTVVEGDAAAAILDIATREEADLIATGSHGYGVWKRLTLGSVASKIMRLCTQSMLVTPIGGVGAIKGFEDRDPSSTEAVRDGGAT